MRETAEREGVGNIDGDAAAMGPEPVGFGQRFCADAAGSVQGAVSWSDMDPKEFQVEPLDTWAAATDDFWGFLSPNRQRLVTSLSNPCRCQSG